MQHEEIERSAGADTWATTKREERRLEVNEMTMMGWLCGVTEKDKIRNEHVRGSVKWHMYTMTAKTKTSVGPTRRTSSAKSLLKHANILKTK